LLRALFYYFFYRLYLYLADTLVHADSGDFCVMSRRAVSLLLNLPEKLRLVRGLHAWIGLPSKPFPISRPARAASSPQYSLSKLTKLAFSALTSFPTKSLRVGFICGSILCFGPVVDVHGSKSTSIFHRSAHNESQKGSRSMSRIETLFKLKQFPWRHSSAPTLQPS
jgi:hypothetical protein